MKRKHNSLIILIALFMGVISCQSKQEEMHQQCGSEFCSLNGGSAIHRLSEMMLDTTVYTYGVQLINATNHQLQVKNSSIENELNYSFRQANIKFKVNKHIEFINNLENIDTIFKNKEVKSSILKKYNLPRTINIYIVPVGTELNGYTDVLTEDFKLYKYSVYNYVFINEKALNNGNTIQHEFGHFFGLQHTFGKSPMENSTDESFDGFNCGKTGDFVCDTPSDPNGKIGKNCTFIGLSSGKLYPVIPDVSNFMSYYPPSCKMSFTAKQYNLIHYFGIQFRSYLTKPQ